jgi:hypothetical protein
VRNTEWCAYLFFIGAETSVSIAKSYELDGWGSIPGRGKISLFSIKSRPALGPIQPPIQWVQGALSPGIKRPGRQADRSPSSSNEVNNGGAVAPHSPIRVHGAVLI